MTIYTPTNVGSFSCVGAHVLFQSTLFVKLATTAFHLACEVTCTLMHTCMGTHAEWGVELHVTPCMWTTTDKHGNMDEMMNWSRNL